MRISTWKEVTDEVNKVVVYGYYDGEEFPERVYIKYPNTTARVIEEDFPLTKPDYDECSDYYSTLDKFNEEKVGVVSDLETTGDVANRSIPELPVVIFEERDVQMWITKLQDIVGKV